jgi:hypothetical protein
MRRRNSRPDAHRAAQAGVLRRTRAPAPSLRRRGRPHRLQHGFETDRLGPLLEVIAACGRREAEEDLLAFAAFPVAHAEVDRSTNPPERLNKAIKHRTDVVGVFPNPAALLRLAGGVLVEDHDEWQVSDRRYLSEGSMAAIRPIDDPTPSVAAPAMLTAQLPHR